CRRSRKTVAGAVGLICAARLSPCVTYIPRLPITASNSIPITNTFVNPLEAPVRLYLSAVGRSRNFSYSLWMTPLVGKILGGTRLARSLVSAERGFQRGHELNESAYAPIADIRADVMNVSEVPRGDICSAANCCLLDHLVGALLKR